VNRAQQSDDQALITHLKLRIEKLNRDRYGPRSERTARLLNQLELMLEELEASNTEDELAAELAAAGAGAAATRVASFTRKRRSRKPFPEHLPRERLIVPGPTACGCCGGARLSRLGEDVTETLEVVPKSWKVIQHVREKFTCRDCEKISQDPAPFHVIARGWAGPSLLAMVLFEKFGQHQPLNRQAERYATLASGQGRGSFTRAAAEADWDVLCRSGLVPRHSGSDWLIPSQFRMGRSSGATRIWILRATPG